MSRWVTGGRGAALAALACAGAAAIAGGADWAQSRVAATDRAADEARALADARAALPAAAAAVAREVADALDRLVHRVAPDASRAALFDALAAVVPPGGGATAWEARGATEPLAWAGRHFGSPPFPLLARLAEPGGGPAVATVADTLRVWVIAGRRLQSLDLFVAAPLGTVDHWLGRVVGDGPVAEAAAGVGVRAWLREPVPDDGVVGVPVPLAPAPGIELAAWVLVPSAADRVAHFRTRAAARGGVLLGLSVVLAALVLARLIVERPWPSAVRRGLLAALPLAARGVLGALGLPPAVPGVAWLDPGVYSGVRDLVPWFATPLDLALTGAAVLAAVAVAAHGRAAPGSGGAAWRAIVVPLVAAIAARAAFALLAGVVGTVQHAGLPLLADDRFWPTAAEAVVLSGLAALGLAAALGVGALGDRALADVERRLDPAPARAWVAVAFTVAFAVPFPDAPLWWRALGLAVVAAATALHRGPERPAAVGLSPLLLRVVCATALVHAGLERALDTARVDATLVAVAPRSEADAWCQDALAAAQRIAADPAVVHACRKAAQELAVLGPEGRAALPEDYALRAARAWARHCDRPPLQAAALEVATWAPGFDRAACVPFMAFGVNAPGPIRGLLGDRPDAAWLQRAPAVETSHEPERQLRLATARAPVGPPDAPLGVVTVTVADPWEAEADTADAWVPVAAPTGLAGPPARVRFQLGVAVAATDARLALIPMPAGAKGAAAVDAPVEYVEWLGDTPYRFRARHEPGGGVRAAGLPALEPGPVVLRFARFLVLAFAVGGAAWLLARRARRWLGLPPEAPWRRRFKHLLVAAFLLLTAPPLVLVALWSQGLLRATLPAGPQAHHRETLELMLVRCAEHSRALAAEASPIGRELTAARIESDLTDAWLAEQAEVLGHEVQLYDPRGGLLSTSRRDLVQAGVREARLPGPVARALLASDESAVFEPLRVGPLTYRVGYRVLRSRAGTPLGVLAIPMLAGERATAARLAQTVSLIWAVSLMAVLAVASIALGLARRLARPMEALTDATRRVATGDLSARVPVTRGDEIGDLQQAFNQMADDLAASRAALVRAEKEAAWRAMAQQIAHEVKNPLTPLKLSAQHLQRAWRDQAPDFSGILSDATQRIIDQVEALRKVASRFSAFAGRPGATPTTVDVNALAADALALYQTADARHVVHTEWASPPPRAHADRDDLRRVFINLVTNALQAMGNGGTLVLRTVRSKHPAPPGRGGTTRRVVAPGKPEAPDGWVGIEVRDDGPGIPPDVQARLFEPYFSTKSSGTGLGLWICRSTIEEMGGEISLTSVPGTGTSAWVWLPRLPDEPQATLGAPAAPPDAR